MRFDLNFWQERDWHRESTLSPYFIIFASAAGMALIGLAMLSMTAAELRKSQNQFEMLNSQNEAIRARALQAARTKKRVGEWNRVVDIYAASLASTMPWSCQLESLQQLIPDDIILQRLDISSGRSGDKPIEDAKLAIPAWEYRLVLSGIAGGDDPLSTINELLDGLESDPRLSPLMTTRLEDTSTNADGSKRFRVLCEYHRR